MKVKFIAIAVSAATLSLANVASASNAPVYADFPVTVKDYQGDKKDSVSYSGQMARHVLHNSLKKLAGTGDGSANNDALQAKMMAYYAGKEEGRDIINPATKGTFVVKQSKVDELSKGKNLKGKTYKGAINGWPGNMTGPEVLEFMIDKAADTKGGFDPLTGLDYTQLISKFAMGAVFYNQAVDNYLDEKLDAGNKPNGKPYKKGAYYTGKEHVWDEAFGYFGVPAHVMGMDAKTAYAIAKGKEDVFAVADANKDGKIDLKTEMTYAHGYYAANADKGGKSKYLHTITKAFIDGRQLITDADGKDLTDAQRNQLKEYAQIIKTNWEKVIAEAAFKYAGSVYKDAMALQEAVEKNGDVKKLFRKYAKHWGELKGFTMALQTSGKDMGETAVKINRLVGFSPVLLGNTQVTGINTKGEYVQSDSISLSEYALHMLKLQKLLDKKFDLVAKNNDQMSSLAGLAEKLGSGSHAEND